MFVFGCSITDLDQYDRCALPGIKLAAEPDSEVKGHQSTTTLFRSYNLLLDEAAGYEDLEGLVLVHQDAEIIDADFCQKIREALSDPDVAVVGCAGAIGVRSIAWWEGAVTWASFSHRYTDWGGGDFEALTFYRDQVPSFAQTGEVDSLDGFVMVLSPWAVRNLRFDESLGTTLHGYDFDFCCQARAAGKKVVTADVRVIHHHSLTLVSDPEAWIAAHMRVAEKWDGHLPGHPDGSGDWKQRARRAEAEAAEAKAEAVSAQMKYEAVVREYKRMIKSASWRVTNPLRHLKRILGRRSSNGSSPREPS
jgi:hypothetical protein